MSEPREGEGRRASELSPEEKAAYQRRLDELGERLGKTKDAADAGGEAEEDARLQRQGMSYGLRMASELVAAVAVGGLIGYGLDRWVFNTWPWLFLVFFFLGCAAGCLNVWRSFQRFQEEIARRTRGNLGKSVPDDDD